MQSTQCERPHGKRREWSRHELEKLVYLVSLYQYDHVNYEEVSRHLWDRSAKEVKRRWLVVRDYIRRKLRDRVRALEREDEQAAPYSGELHQSLKWVETRWWDIEEMKL